MGKDSRCGHSNVLLVQIELANWIQSCPNPDTSTSHRSETNGAAERAVCRVKEGTTIALVQSGLPEQWWDCAMGCYRYLAESAGQNGGWNGSIRKET